MAADFVSPARMPMGKFSGEAVCTLPTGYLFWCSSQDWLRRDHQALAANIIAELRKRLWTVGAVEKELLPGFAPEGDFDGADLV